MLEAETLHVIPVDDLREHEAASTCWCHPTPLEDQPSVYLHNAMDDREKYESGKVPLQ